MVAKTLSRKIQADVGELSDAELADLQAQLERELAARQARRRTEFIRTVQAQAAELQVDAREIIAALSSKPVVRRRPASPKYANPLAPHETWSGRGKMPNWMRRLIEEGRGRAPEDFRIRDEARSAPATSGVARASKARKSRRVS